MDFATWIVGLLVLAAAVLAIAFIIRNRKKGGCGSCSGCPYSASCSGTSGCALRSQPKK